MTPLPMGQWDVGPMIPGVCALTGFVIIPVTLVTLFLSARRKTRSVLTIAFAIVTSLLLVAWIAAAIDLRHEPSIDDVGAVAAVENLPEVQQFEAQRAGDPSLTRDASVINDSPDSPSVEVTVGDFDQTGRPKLVWHVFVVNTVTGEIQVLGPEKKWESLQAWRAASLR